MPELLVLVLFAFVIVASIVNFANRCKHVHYEVELDEEFEKF